MKNSTHPDTDNFHKDTAIFLDLENSDISYNEENQLNRQLASDQKSESNFNNSYTFYSKPSTSKPFDMQVVHTVEINIPNSYVKDED